MRILGEVKREYAELLRRADAIFIEELRAGDEPAQRQELVRPDRAGVRGVPAGRGVGVMGDGRTYDHVVALRAVQTSDFMTADWADCRTRC